MPFFYTDFICIRFFIGNAGNSELCFCSSQMLFYICKKLTSHQMLSSTEILKWLREILICRNKFLLKNKVSKMTSFEMEEYLEW